MMPMLRPTFMAASVAVVVGLSCTDAPMQPSLAGPSFAISDGMTGGNQHFYFLPPIVSQPEYSGAFDAGLNPLVLITADGEPDITLVPILLDEESYHVNWHTADYDLDSSKKYRIAISVDGFEVGFAEVVIGTDMRALKNMNTGEVVPLVDGRSLPVRFRIEEGALLVGRSQTVRVVAGEFYSCALDGSGKAFCWGRNEFGEVGDGTTAQRVSPAAVEGGLSFVALADGDHHVCGLDAAGRAYCWGQNTFGQLGNGNTIDQPNPVAVEGGRRFVKLVAGGRHTCGLDPLGALHCWGNNHFGALGDGTEVNRTSPTAAASNLIFDDLAAGIQFTCGIESSSSRVLCWGNNNHGQLGNGSRSSFRDPREVVGGRTFSVLVADEHRVCGLDPEGNAFCWGSNSNGSGGNPAVTDTRVLSPTASALGHVFKQIDPGESHTCAITKEGDTVCWGRGDNGQLGNGNTTVINYDPILVAGDYSFTQVSAGGAHTCGRTDANGVACWGFNFYGQLGDGTNSDRLVPILIFQSD